MKNLKHIMQLYGITGVMLHNASFDIEMPKGEAPLMKGYISNLRNGKVKNYERRTLEKVIAALQALVPPKVVITEKKLCLDDLSQKRARRDATGGVAGC